MVLLFLNMGEGEITLIVLVIILFFGSKSIPTLARGLGKGIREFKDAKDNVKKEIEDHMHDDNSGNSASGSSSKQVSSGSSINN